MSFVNERRGNEMTNSFSEKIVRLRFIRKVYGILTVQLAVTLGFIGIFFIEEVKKFTAENWWLWIMAMVILFVVIIGLACCQGLRRQTPYNFILLGVFTLAQSFVLGTITSFYQVNEVLIAVGACAGITLGLTIFAFQTKIDFTVIGGFLLAALLCFMIFGIIAIFFPANRTLRLVYAAIGCLIFSLYIVYDTQLMIGGKHSYALSPEEYIFAALNLYMDIVQLFLFILRIVGAARN